MKTIDQVNKFEVLTHEGWTVCGPLQLEVGDVVRITMPGGELHVNNGATVLRITDTNLSGSLTVLPAEPTDLAAIKEPAPSSLFYMVQ